MATRLRLYKHYMAAGMKKEAAEMKARLPKEPVVEKKKVSGK